jgi:hypothetical protein
VARDRNEAVNSYITDMLASESPAADPTLTGRL